MDDVCGYILDYIKLLVRLIQVMVFPMDLVSKINFN